MKHSQIICAIDYRIKVNRLIHVSLFAVGGVLNQLQDDREVVIAYASRSLRLSKRRYCMTRREMLMAVVMCTHFRSSLRGAQFTLRTDNSYLRWLQKLCNEDGMLARWYLMLGQFSVTFEYRSGAQHANADRMFRQCGKCTDRIARFPRRIRW